jgi:putative Mg2+ transporter-C (MgtC) family protein
VNIPAMDWHDLLDLIGRLMLATALGGAIGFERESHGQSAGFRTNILVAIGACLLMMLSLHMESMFESLGANSSVRIDPGRIASYTVASMGFLGAGAIIKGRGTVRGLTTAAGLWMVTGIGLAVGARYYVPAITTTMISLLILYNLRHLKHFISHDVYTILTINCSAQTRQLSRIRAILENYRDIEIRFINYFQDIDGQTVSYRLRLRTKEHLPWGTIVGRLRHEIRDIKSISWEEGEVP